VSRPLIYSLSVAASASSWLYYGSTGYAAKYGIEFVGLYIGIVLVFTLGFPLLRKIVALAKSEGITSISDFIGAHYGKFARLARRIEGLYQNHPELAAHRCSRDFAGSSPFSGMSTSRDWH